MTEKNMYQHLPRRLLTVYVPAEKKVEMCNKGEHNEIWKTAIQRSFTFKQIQKCPVLINCKRTIWEKQLAVIWVRYNLPLGCPLVGRMMDQNNYVDDDDEENRRGICKEDEDGIGPWW